MNSSKRKTVNKESFLDFNKQAFVELLTFVDFADSKLNIGLVEINFARDRDTAIKALINHPNCQDIQFQIIDLSDPDLHFVRDEIVTKIENIKIKSDKKLVLLITGLEKSIGAWQEYPDVLTNLNFVRDELRTSIPHPILFFLPNYAITRLAKYAPDFWAWNRNTFIFKTVSSNLPTLTKNTFDSYKSINTLVVQEKQERIGLLQSLLKEYQTEDLPASKQDSSNIAKIYNELGNIYKSIGECEQPIYFYEQSLINAIKAEDRLGEGYALNNIGNAYNGLEEYQKAIDFNQQSLFIFQEIGDFYGQSNSLGNIGSAYNYLGEYQKAIEFHKKALSTATKIGDKESEARCLNNIGNVYNKLEEYQQAIEFNQQSLLVFQEVENLLGQSSSLCNIGNAYGYLKEYQQAINFYQYSLNIGQKNGDRNIKSTCFNNLAHVYYSLGECGKAIDYYHKSLDINRQIGNRTNEAKILFNIGLCWQDLQEKLKAKDAYAKARKIFKKLELDKDVEDCDRALEDLD